jgi:hypothetical protein
MKTRKSKLMIMLKAIAGMLLLVIVYFIQPFSTLKSSFNKDVNQLISITSPESQLFSQADIASLPLPVQKYFTYCGYVGSQKMSYMKVAFEDVTFSTGINKPNLRIDYIQYNYVKTPDRLAFIDSRVFGIPFQGYDSYNSGTGNMKGVIAKTFTLFDQKGDEMDKASLVTFLSECLFVPAAALQDYITWEAIDETHAKATINYLGKSGSGIFTFSEAGEMIEFTTGDRESIDFAGNKKKVKWSAKCNNYKKNKDGVLRPTILQAVWHYPEGDLIYFDGNDITFTFGF